MSSYLLHILITTLLAVLKIVCLLVAIAYFTLAERKIMAAVQRRVGPNVVGPFGLLQPLADGLKLAGKELAIPAQASSRIFLTVAITVLLFALSGWAAIPFGMFDHSEYMDTHTTIKVLLLSEPTPAVVVPSGHAGSVSFWEESLTRLHNRKSQARDFASIGWGVLQETFDLYDFTKAVEVKTWDKIHTTPEMIEATKQFVQNVMSNPAWQAGEDVQIPDNARSFVTDSLRNGHSVDIDSREFANLLRSQVSAFHAVYRAHADADSVVDDVLGEE